jgi:hypothetical protein
MILVGIPCPEQVAARTFAQAFFHQTRRKSHPAIVQVHLAAVVGIQFQRPLVFHAHPGLFQDIECSPVDGLYLFRVEQIERFAFTRKSLEHGITLYFPSKLRINFTPPGAVGS